ncbi:MAG: alginate lyase family protein, partial [Clostridia bacterium]|nr:alginate lyase family protein [Clostridia bacterium]
MPYIKDWEPVKRKIEKYDWAQKVYNDMKARCDYFVEKGYDDLDRVSGWGHNYVCEKCGEGLKFDLDRPVGQLCPACGHVNMKAPQNDAWTCSYRAGYIGSAESAAMLYKLTGQRHYVEHAQKVISFYADNYQKLRNWVVHPMYLGRLNGQHLTDDSSVIAIVVALSILREELGEDYVQEIGDKLLIPEALFLKPFAYYINNIPVWDLCAIAAVGVLYNRHDLVDYAFNSDFGLINQVKLGLTKENFWYEGSVHYHFYCVGPMNTLLQYIMAMDYKADYITDFGETLRDMYVMPAELSFANGMLPNPNDGWPFISLANNTAAYDTINACYDHPMIKWVCANMYDGRMTMMDKNLNKVQTSGGIQRLIFGIDPVDYDKYQRPQKGSQVWEDTNFSMLRRGDLEVFLKHGLIISSHSHFDIMNIEVASFGEITSYDLSTNGYGSFLFNWQQGTLSHFTVMTDIRNIPKKSRGELLEFDADNAHIKARAKDCYPNVDYTRDLTVTEDNRLLDTFTCEDATGKEHIYDYTCYFSGKLGYDFEPTPCQTPEKETKVALQAIKRAVTNNDDATV